MNRYGVTKKNEQTEGESRNSLTHCHVMLLSGGQASIVVAPLRGGPTQPLNSCNKVLAGLRHDWENIPSRTCSRAWTVFSACSNCKFIIRDSAAEMLLTQIAYLSVRTSRLRTHFESTKTEEIVYLSRMNCPSKASADCFIVQRLRFVEQFALMLYEPSPQKYYLQ
ncbi:hypothetical protein BJX99DRAFT_90081 [Aspergillus californicus]